MSKKSLAALLVVTLAILACRPVIGISGNELLLIGILIAALFGPPIYRFIRKLQEYRNQKDK